METENTVIGRAEQLAFPEQGYSNVPARIDTGAKTSSIWVSQAQERDGRLEVVFFDQDAAGYDGVVHAFDQFDQLMVANSTGQMQNRYKVQLLVRIRGKRIRAWFTLADRSSQVYPVLIGRNVLRGKFIVDVKKGRTLKDAAAWRPTRLQLNPEQPTGEEEV